jgi:regulator of cell morphogenesis and NO signaling
MQEFTTKTIREIALEMPLTTRIFEEFKIDFCCGGRKPFVEACHNAGVEPKLVLAKIERALEAYGNSSEFEYVEKKTASELIDYILETHHVFTKKEIVRLTALMEKVSFKHGETHPELIELRDAFRLLCDDLIVHIRKEEMILFPFIKALENALSNDLSVPAPPFGTVKNPIQMMFEEHDTAGELLRKMRNTTKNYWLPEGACPSYSGLYFGLQDLERDLHQHIHLENNVLFPQAIELEQRAFEEKTGIKKEELITA